MVPGRRSGAYGGLLRDLEEGYAKRLAIVVPPGAVWPLPAYELALMTAGEAQEMGQSDVQVTVVTPERAPLSLFGEQASEAVADELRWAGVDVKTGVVARKDGDGLVLEPSGERLDVQRVFAVPRIARPGDRRRAVRRRGVHRSPTTRRAWRAASAPGRPATASSRR